MGITTLLAQITTTSSSNGDSVLWSLVSIALSLVLIVSLWVIFTKAKHPGWAAIIPIYNIYVLLKVVGRPGWWLLLYLIPFVNIVVHLVVAIDFAKAFGKSTTFGVFGLWLFSIIGYPMLAFGDARYEGAPKH